MTKISIITAVFNCEATIAETMESVASQAVPPFEHVVFDGRSQDGTLRIVDTKRHPFTKVVSEEDDGLYDALNRGIRASSGDVIGFIHADDVYPDCNVLSHVAAAFDTDNVDCCYGDLEYVATEDTDRIIRYWRAGKFRPGNFRAGWMPPHPTFYARREVYERLGLYDTSFSCAADYELMLRFLHKNELSVKYIPEVLMKMRLGGVSNRNLKRIAIKTREDLRAWKVNGLKGGPRAVFLKNVTKLPQFFRRRVAREGRLSRLGSRFWGRRDQLDEQDGDSSSMIQ